MIRRKTFLYITPLIILLASLFLFSCASSGGVPEADTGPAKEAPKVSLRLADARPDLSAVVTAIYAMLREPGEPLNGTVLFDQPLLIDGQGGIEGFGLADVAIEEDTRAEEDPLFRKTSGMMRLADPVGREMYWSYTAEYLLQDEGILILSSATAPIYGKFDKFRLFFVEKDQLPALSYLEKAEFEELLPLVAANASDPAELSAADGMKEMYLFLFDMTRSEESLQLELYSDGGLADVAMRNSRSVNRKGWRFLMAEGSFRFGPKAGYKLYAAEPRDSTSRLLSVLSVNG